MLLARSPLKQVNRVPLAKPVALYTFSSDVYNYAEAIKIWSKILFSSPVLETMYGDTRPEMRFERKCIDNEFQENRRDPANAIRWLVEILKSEGMFLANFNAGNLETLSKDDDDHLMGKLEELRGLYRQRPLNICIYSKQQLDSEIVFKSLRMGTATIATQFDSEERRRSSKNFSEHVIVVKSDDDRQQLSLLLSKKLDCKESNALRFICEMMETESEGSLLRHLLDSEIATACYAVVLFNSVLVTVHLTEIGMESIQKQRRSRLLLTDRDVPVAISLCSTNAIWYTTSLEEHEKCQVVRAGGVTSGVYPTIECKEPAISVVSCLADVSAGRADLMGIDSNFGFLARHTYNLTAALYAETENAKYSSVVAIIKTKSSYERFENLRNSKACFAEFGGIALMAFINTGKSRGFFSKSECNYGRLLSNYFGSSCAPGATDFGHDPSSSNSDSLCSLCKTMVMPIQPIITIAPPEEPTIGPPSITIAPLGNSPRFDDEGNQIQEAAAEEAPPTTVPEDETVDLTLKAAEIHINCNADSTNRFYGNRGALRCLHEEGDVAILELQYLREHAADLGLSEHDFRIICRNGSWADRTGFDVDAACPLTTIVDNEIVVRPKSDKIPGIINALNSFDKYFSINPDFKMYNVFNGFKHLLFKDSTLGVVSYDEEVLGETVQNYKTLFSNLEECVQGSSTTATVSTTLLLTITVSFILRRMYE